MEYKMLFDLPPILGLAPIFLYMFLGFRGVHPLIATVSSCFLGAVLSQQTLMSFAVSIKNGAGSFLALIGLLVVLGTSLAEVLKESGGGQILVRGILKHFGHSQRGIILGTMIALVIFSVSLGSMVASTALVATVAIAMAATAKISPSAMAIAFHCGSVAGLFIGPFSAPTVQMLEISKLTYWEYLLGVSLPMAIIVFCVGVFMSFRAQRLYGSTMLYPEEDAEKLDDEFTPTNPQKRSAWAFCLTITSLIAYGIYIKGGMTFAFAIMILVAIITGLSGGMGTKGTMDTMLRGGERMLWFYLMFVFFDPFIVYVGQTGAFSALVTLFKPVIDAFGAIGFIIGGAAIGIFGISGAAVAQVTLMDSMFRQIFASFTTIPLTLYLTMLFMGAQITSFAYPGADMMAEMGLARSSNIRSITVNGFVVTGIMLIYITIRSFISI